ncbi:Uncharacterized conserved protein, DUF2141 family [Tenacibaculum sp. MAR_2009_124]|uniref:DUF2141 domain-containing protein n=1 Tax=Tenacibaculum sp. MAR_2009_124 TaxID=1250059 RepID=UPI00089485C6|nr:DUF2141 domain-containing protein [Tenacibaculum sp. MAR_2009_124]SEB53225.1 Uncharacterized conserved protein, DUF2141 family [Tenacibaculum sp. MAR_2009_124]
MKFIINVTLILSMFAVKVATAQNQSIEITVVNATSDKGMVIFALYNKANYMKQPIQGKTATITKGKSSVVFKNVAAGEYAVICYHDKNSNEKMDFEANGMPLEDYGATNNKMNFGPPRYDDAKFDVTDKNVSLKIRF